MRLTPAPSRWARGVLAGCWLVIPYAGWVAWVWQSFEPLLLVPVALWVAQRLDVTEPEWIVVGRREVVLREISGATRRGALAEAPRVSALAVEFVIRDGPRSARRVTLWRDSLPDRDFRQLGRRARHDRLPRVVRPRFDLAGDLRVLLS